VPGYIVRREEEGSVEFNNASPFTDDMHPMRMSAEARAAFMAKKEESQRRAEAARAAEAKADAEEAGITAEDGEI
jgi:small subunit ribosomal protein S4